MRGLLGGTHLCFTSINPEKVVESISTWGIDPTRDAGFRRLSLRLHDDIRGHLDRRPCDPVDAD